MRGIDARGQFHLQQLHNQQERCNGHLEFQLDLTAARILYAQVRLQKMWQ